MYHEFLDVFCEKTANVLPTHWEYDHPIDLVAGSKVPKGRT